ncbi:hypothetical protein [Pararobbsia silviterrae]|uniref:Uncharacterized protein n=1 Tax=Pararobbsia silviterrae TaxID=1792498 RepID=A0A494X2V3_9BURK|nr:hypothetical protein [Pararobbsia silviterrae]RKP44670.1 hypothetical protein D7S86_26940 [Pararobbsia silviterrae]
MKFDELQNLIKGADDLAKSLSAAPTEPINNAAVAAAAKDGAAAGGDGNTTAQDPNASAGDTPAEGDEEDEDNPLAKSFSLTLEDGTTLEGFDGTELIKSLRAELAAESGARVADGEQFLKAFGSVISIVNTLTAEVDSTKKANAALGKQLDAAAAEIATLKAAGEELTKSLATFGNEGRGRRAATLVVHKPPVGADAGTDPVQPSKAEILAKALSAMQSGAISGSEASRIEATLNAGQQVSKALLDRIFK